MRHLPDEAPHRADLWVAGGLALAMALIKVPTLGTPAFWDEMGWLDQTRWLSENNLLRVIPGTRPAAAFWGHPPGLHLTGAIPFKLFGASLVVAHAVIAGFAALGVAATYLLARLRFDVPVAVAAALLLALSPIYVAQAGLFQADLPVAAMAVLCVYLAWTGRYVAYLLCAAYLVMLKETAMAPIVALVVYRVVVSRQPWRSRAIDALRYGAPLAIIGGFVALQKLVTGKAFFIFDFEFQSVAVTDVKEVVRHARDITRWIFLEQGRWLLTVAIVLNLALHAEARRDSIVRLFGLVVLLSGYAFSVLYLAPRYLLPVLPFYYIVAAASVLSFVTSPRARRMLAVALPAVALAALVRSPRIGSMETSLRYQRSVKLHKALADTLVARWPSARLMTAWPVGTELQNPLYGYVRRPWPVVWFDPRRAPPEADLAVISSPANPQMEALRQLARERQWPLLRRMEDEEFLVEVYAIAAVRSPRER